MWWNGWRKRDFKDLSMSSLVGRCSCHVSWSFYRPRQLQTVTSKDVWCRCTPDNFLLVWRYEFKRLCNYSRNICLKCTVTLTYLLHKPKIQFWRQMTITLMVMDTFFSSSYLLCLFCFFFCLVFTFSWTSRDESVDGEALFCMNEDTVWKASCPQRLSVLNYLPRSKSSKRASEQSSFPLPGETIEIAENEPLVHGTPTCSKNLDDSNDIALAKKGNDL